MVRFKVIKGSQLLLGAAIVILALVICALVLRYTLSEPVQPASLQGNFVTATENTAGAEAVSAFASTSAAVSIQNMPFSPEEEIEILILDPQHTSAENEHTDEIVNDVDIEIIPEAPLPAGNGTKPRILIYHTHTHEAYEQVDNDPYVALEAWRTADEAHSVVRVGEELALLLRERGFEVIHDATDHEQSELSTAYTRSLETLQSYSEPFDLYIDLHRDAYVENCGPLTVQADNRQLARLMILIGSGESFSVKPHYAENYAFAVSLTQQLNAEAEGICKDVLVKKNRYNQHIGVHSILIEVGNNRNTLTEALASMPYLADALENLMLSPDTPDSPAMQLAADVIK